MKGIPNTEHIRKNGCRYEVFKTVNGKWTYFATGKTLIIALMKRDWCKANNWKKYPVKFKYIKKTPVGNYIIEKHEAKNKTASYGTFKTLEEAEKELELLKECDWDYEILCNIDETNNNPQYLPLKLRSAGVWK